MPEGIDVERLGRRLRRMRDERGLTLKDLSDQIDVSIATLSRVERGGSKDVDAGTLVVLAKWIGADASEFRLGSPPPRTPGNRSSASTPEAVELYLRADKNLDPKAAGLLAEMFKAAYDRLSKEIPKKG